MAESLGVALGSSDAPTPTVPPSAEVPTAQDVLAASFEITATTLSLLVAAAGALVLIGWAWGSAALARLLPGLDPMRATTAGALVLTGLALWLAHSAPRTPWRDRTLTYLAGAAGLVALITLGEYAVGSNLLVDRVPLSAAIGLVLFDGAILLAERRGRYGIAQALVGVTAILTTLDLVSAVCGRDVFAGLGLYGPMGLQTSMGLLILCFAFFLARPEEGVMRVVIAAGPGGLVVRRILPAVYALPLLLVWLSWQGVRAGWYAPGFAMAVFAVLTITGLSVVIWAGGQMLHRFEDKRLAAERLRQQSEDRLRRAVTDAPVPIIIHDEAGAILHMSRGWSELSGYTLSDTPRVSDWIARAQPDAETAVQAYLQRLNTAAETRRGGEARIRAKSGPDRVWEFSTTPLGTLGEQKAFVTMALDVTERKRAEADLRRMNEGLEQRITNRTVELTRANDALKRQSDQLQEQAALLDLVRDGILVRDLFGTIIYWSAGAAELYGFSTKEALGAVSHQLLRAAYTRPLAEIERQVMDSGYWEGELVHTTKQGGSLAIESRWTLTRTERGVPQGFLEVNRDITARKRAQDSLRDSERRFRAVSESANEGIVTLDAEGRIEYWNPGASRMFGLSADHAVGQTVTAFIPDRPGRTDGASLSRVLAAGEAEVAGATLELVGLRADRRDFPIEVSLSSWQSTHGLCFTGILRDITARKHAEWELQAKAEELARSNQELEQFAYVASHDLQEPLRMVSNYTQLLGRRYGDKLDGDAQEFIDFAVDGAKRMQALIHDLLQYARVGTRGKEFKPTPAKEIVGDALANLAGAIEESHAEIVVDALPTLTCDALQLGQVFQNLIGNAIKFRRRDVKPVVRLTATRENTMWWIGIADNGIGIEPKYYERIFQMFQRLHGRDEYPGTGIGLALCKKIVERHGGRIRVASNDGGHGATFSFSIPDTPAKGGA